MEPESNGRDRRGKILEMIRNTEKPLSGSALGKITGVSRQVVVQDIALLRTEGYRILATPRGYLMENPPEKVRLFKACHSEDQVEEELNTVVDLGGTVLDVVVNHRTYGKISAPLNIRSRRDVQAFIGQIRSGKSSLLMNVTSGYHFHHISAESEDILDEIQEKLQEKGFLAPILPYEQGNI